MRRQSTTANRSYYPFFTEIEDAIALVYEVMTYQTSAPDACTACGGPLVRVKQNMLQRVFCKPVYWCVRCIRTCSSL